jgi:hypothetical protein
MLVRPSCMMIAIQRVLLMIDVARGPHRLHRKMTVCERDRRGVMQLVNDLPASLYAVHIPNDVWLTKRVTGLFDIHLKQQQVYKAA